MNARGLKEYVLVACGAKSSEMAGFRLITKLAQRWVPGYRFTWPTLAWFRSPKLNAILERFGERDGFNAHRRLALQQLLRLTAEVPGDTAECGVFKGCGSYIILDSLRYASYTRIHHIFDSFAGLSAPAAIDGSYWNAKDMAVSESDVRRNLQEFEHARFHAGWIPTRFADVSGHTFSFVHVDVDLYEPTYASIHFFYNRLASGGILVCDDYGFLTCPGATAAIDDFLRDKKEKMIMLAGGGGFFIKGCATSEA